MRRNEPTCARRAEAEPQLAREPSHAARGLAAFRFFRVSVGGLRRVARAPGSRHPERSPLGVCGARRNHDAEMDRDRERRSAPRPIREGVLHVGERESRIVFGPLHHDRGESDLAPGSRLHDIRHQIVVRARAFTAATLQPVEKGRPWDSGLLGGIFDPDAKKTNYPDDGRMKRWREKGGAAGAI